jgi:RNA polymerase sigma factor (sigma-70 family)
LSADASFTTTARVRAPARPRLRLRVPRGRSDDALVARVRAGDERAFELIFDRYHRGLLAFCRQMVASHEEAEDALQHTFMAAHRALGASDKPIHLKAWLYTIARNRCLSILRARREQVVLDEGHAATDGLAADVDRRADLQGLLADLERLPDDQRAALVLFELGDHSPDEIAEVLGVRREKVKALVFQARESLASWRRARETPCVEIREQLATLRGAALKRAILRRHVARCEGCAEFEVEVRRQRAAMAALLPVLPTVGLKAAVLSAVGVGAGGAGGGASLAGLGGAAKGLAAKTMLCAAVAGSAGSAGYVTVREVELHGGHFRAPAAAASHVQHRAAKRAAPAAKPIVAPARVSAVVSTPAKAVKTRVPASKRSRRAHSDAGRAGRGRIRHGHRDRTFARTRSRRAANLDGHGRSRSGRSARGQGPTAVRDQGAAGRDRNGRSAGRDRNGRSAGRDRTGRSATRGQRGR